MAEALGLDYILIPQISTFSISQYELSAADVETIVEIVTQELQRKNGSNNATAERQSANTESVTSATTQTLDAAHVSKFVLIDYILRRKLNDRNTAVSHVTRGEFPESKRLGQCL